MASISIPQNTFSRLTSFFGCELDFEVSKHDLDEQKMHDPWDVLFDKSLGSLVFDIVLEYSEKLI